MKEEKNKEGRKEGIRRRNELKKKRKKGGVGGWSLDKQNRDIHVLVPQPALTRARALSLVLPPLFSLSLSLSVFHKFLGYEPHLAKCFRMSASVVSGERLPAKEQEMYVGQELNTRMRRNPALLFAPLSFFLVFSVCFFRSLLMGLTYQ